MKTPLLIAVSLVAFNGCETIEIPDTATGAAPSGGAVAGSGAFSRQIGQGEVTITEQGKTVSVLKSAAPNVEVAEFTGPGQEEIAVKSRGSHGPASLELFDTRTGALKDKVLAYAVQNGQPAWAAKYAE